MYSPGCPEPKKACYPKFEPLGVTLGEDDNGATPSDPLARPRLSSSPTVVAAVITAAGVIAAALIGVLATTGNGGSTAEGPPAPAPAPSAHEYEQFVSLRDDTGALVVDVPLEWNDTRTNGWYPEGLPGYEGYVGPGMNAAPNVGAWFRDNTTPGVFVGASSSLSHVFDPVRLLDAYARQGCTLADERSYAARGLSGQQQSWECASHRWFHLAAQPDDGAYLVLVQMKLVEQRDAAARDQLLSSLRIMSGS